MAYFVLGRYLGSFIVMAISVRVGHIQQFASSSSIEGYNSSQSYMFEDLEIKHSKKCSTIIKLFKRKKNILSTTEKVFYLEKVTANRQVIAIGISEANPLAESVDCFRPVYYVPIRHLQRNLDKKRSSPIIILLYSV